jgi:hypothetical protein
MGRLLDLNKQKLNKMFVPVCSYVVSRHSFVRNPQMCVNHCASPTHCAASYAGAAQRELHRTFHNAFVTGTVFLSGFSLFLNVERLVVEGIRTEAVDTPCY